MSFNYPGSKATRSALSNVSFSVKSGQLVVIVGSNGSGKSTIVKILNNLYNPNSGEILVDGKPVNSYRINDLRQATADLSQDHTIYPLSLRENIGLGHAPYVLNADLITASAKLGGAFDFVSKLQDGFDTTLQPVQTAYMGLVNEGDGHPLKELYDKLEKQVEISGMFQRYAHDCISLYTHLMNRRRKAAARRVSSNVFLHDKYLALLI